MAVVRGSSAIPVGGSFNPAGNVPLDARLWVDNIDDLKELVDEAHNYANPTINVGALVYVEAEDAHYRIVGDGHNNVAGYAKWQVSTNVVFQEEEPTDKDVLWVSESDNSAAEWHTEENIISNMQNRITELENQVEKLLAILRYGAIAGDSTIGGRTSIMDTAPVCTNPTTSEDEPTYEPGTERPQGLLATIPNLSPKHDTAANFSKNIQNLINGELLWIQANEDYISGEDPGLHMFVSNKFGIMFIPLASGTGGGSGNIPGTVTSKVYFDENGILEVISNLYKVNDDGILEITDPDNFKVENGILYITTGETSSNTPGGNDTEEKIIATVTNNGILEISSQDNSILSIDSNGILTISDGSVYNNGILNL